MTSASGAARVVTSEEYHSLALSSAGHELIEDSPTLKAELTEMIKSLNGGVMPPDFGGRPDGRLDVPAGYRIAIVSLLDQYAVGILVPASTQPTYMMAGGAKCSCKTSGSCDTTSPPFSGYYSCYNGGGCPPPSGQGTNANCSLNAD